MSDHRALVIGEALVDVIVHADGTREEHPGGSPANVALGLARLGRRVDLLTWLAHDAYGRRVTSHLEASGVHLLSGDRSALTTPTSVAWLDESGQAARYDFDLTWEMPGAVADDTAPLVVHTGSIAATLQPGGPAVLREITARRALSTVTYDPNARPAIMGTPAQALAVVNEFVRVADVVKASDEDVAWLCPGRDIETVAEDWARSGPAVVVVTRGGAGVSAVTAGGIRLTIPARPVEVADTLGAGDSFMSGLIDGLWHEELLGGRNRGALRAIDEDTLRRVLDRCLRIAAITVSRAGANPPRLAELAEAQD
ncbi:MAG: carbohydrate kinase [Micrococcales bacterium]|nr:carbohydrate kinase [Micrococcales bacterium]